MSDKWTDGKWSLSYERDRPALAETMDSIFYPTNDDGDLRIAWEYHDDLLEIIDTHNAVKSLSPSTRDLLIRSPEAIEKAVVSISVRESFTRFCLDAVEKGVLGDPSLQKRWKELYEAMESTEQDAVKSFAAMSASQDKAKET